VIRLETMVTEKEKTITTLKRRLLLNEHDTAAQPKERNDTAEMKLMIQKNQIMIETVLLRMEQLRIQLAVPKQQDLPQTLETNVSTLIDKQANNQLVNDNNPLRAYNQLEGNNNVEQHANPIQHANKQPEYNNINKKQHSNNQPLQYNRRVQQANNQLMQNNTSTFGSRKYEYNIPTTNRHKTRCHNMT
jgi:hypothetical protein